MGGIPAASQLSLDWTAAFADYVPWKVDLKLPDPDGSVIESIRYGDTIAEDGSHRRRITRVEGVAGPTGRVVVGELSVTRTGGEFALFERAEDHAQSLRKRMSLEVHRHDHGSGTTMSCRVEDLAGGEAITMSVDAPAKDQLTGGERLVLRVERGTERFEREVVLTDAETPQIISGLVSDGWAGHRLDDTFLMPLVADLWEVDAAVHRPGGIAQPEGWRCWALTIVVGITIGWVAGVIARILCWEGSAH